MADGPLVLYSGFPSDTVKPGLHAGGPDRAILAPSPGAWISGMGRGTRFLLEQERHLDNTQTMKHPTPPLTSPGHICMAPMTPSALWSCCSALPLGREHPWDRNCSRVVVAPPALNAGLHTVGVQEAFQELHLLGLKNSYSKITKESRQ